MTAGQREANGVCEGVRYFHTILAGHRAGAMLETDHANLLYCKDSKCDKLRRCASAMADLDLRIVHIPGANMGLTDLLSRCISEGGTDVQHVPTREPPAPPVARVAAVVSATAGLSWRVRDLISNASVPEPIPVHIKFPDTYPPVPSLVAAVALRPRAAAQLASPPPPPSPTPTPTPPPRVRRATRTGTQPPLRPADEPLRHPALPYDTAGQPYATLVDPTGQTSYPMRYHAPPTAPALLDQLRAAYDAARTADPTWEAALVARPDHVWIQPAGPGALLHGLLNGGANDTEPRLYVPSGEPGRELRALLLLYAHDTDSTDHTGTAHRTSERALASPLSEDNAYDNSGR
jgi:hypothetical protein